MKLEEFTTTARDAISARRVYGEPTEKDGVTIIPAANVGGGGGAGIGHQEGKEGEGGGFGASGRPAGAYIIKDGTVRWMPAVDVNRVIGFVAAMVITYLITRVRVAKARAKRLARTS
jgi:uncharacterized spore protein YtfJ